MSYTISSANRTGAADSTRHSHNTINHLNFIRHVRYSAHARSLTQTHLPSHVQTHHNYLQQPVATWEGYTDVAYAEHGAMTGARSAASNTSSGKRKRSSPKFYAVRVGRKPGIYNSWEDCRVQVEGIYADRKPSFCLTLNTI